MGQLQTVDTLEQTSSAPADESILLTVLSHYRIIVVAALVGAMVAMAASFLFTPIYHAQTLISPVKQDDKSAGLAELASQFGGLAGLAGISLGQNEANPVAKHLAILQSRDFIQRFLQQDNRVAVLTGKTLSGPEDEELLWQAYEQFKEKLLHVHNNVNTGLITVAIAWTDPRQASQWANDIVIFLNEHIRQQVIHEANRSLTFLKQEVAKTPIVRMQEVLYSLMEKQIEKIMLANVRKEYAFTVVESALKPIEQEFPRPLPMMLLGAILSGLFAVLWVLWPKQ